MSASKAHAKHDTILMPSDSDSLLGLENFLEHHAEPAALVGPDGQKEPLTEELYELLVRAVRAVRQQQAVAFSPVDQRLTTQQAADLLGIRRPTLIKLLDQEKIPYERPSGSRHRRLKLRDVLDYQARRRDERDQIFTDLVHDAQDSGLDGDTPVEDYYAALKEARAELCEQP